MALRCRTIGVLGRGSFGFRSVFSFSTRKRNIIIPPLTPVYFHNHKTPFTNTVRFNSNVYELEQQLFLKQMLFYKSFKSNLLFKAQIECLFEFLVQPSKM